MLRLADNRTIAVVGAGIVGTFVALRLLRDGHHVVLLDPATPGSGASSGNAGCFSPSSVVPLAGPGMMRNVPGWLLDPLGPLAIRGSYLPRLAPWLVRFIRAGRADRVERQAAALHTLIGPCLHSLIPVLDQAGARSLIRTDGSLVVYRNERDWAGDSAGRDLRRKLGIVFDELGRDDLLAFDPGLTPDVVRGIYFPNNAHTIDPERLVLALAEAFVRGGGKIVCQRSEGFRIEGGRLKAVVTQGNAVAADAAVIAAGAFSASLALAAGEDVPLETERGYHAMLSPNTVAPRVPTLDASGKFVATPMRSGVRLAGTVEFAGLAAAPDWRRAHSLLALGKALYPGIAAEARPAAVWMGHRPSLPDSLPVIGHAGRCRDIVLAFGHGHLGMTGAPRTAEIVADLVAGRAPGIDLSPFAPDRFR